MLLDEVAVAALVGVHIVDVQVAVSGGNQQTKLLLDPGTGMARAMLYLERNTAISEGGDVCSG